ncbi:hypothetical protein [Pseudooceanicola sp.]|uniref:hypothetical protein n=1 Tax=Pseudooceanicola sp. TaxID=1914328 RepID=UPI0035C6A86C
MIRTALAALLLSAAHEPVMAQESPSLFPKKPAAGSATGSGAASLFPQADLEAAAGISVGQEAAPEDEDTPSMTVESPTDMAEPQPVADSAAPETEESAESRAAAFALDQTAPAETAEEDAEVPTEQGEPSAPEVVQTAAATPLIRPRQRPEALSLQPEEVGQICSDPAAIRDRDVQRNLGAFEVDPNLCISEERFAEHGRRWHMVIIANRKARRGPIWAILHDNEDSAFDAALYSVSRYGGKMVALETGEGRSFNGQDPNRNFGADKGLTAPCRNMASRPAPAFTAAINRHFDRRYPVLTMHSNENGHVGNGGAGHISAARTSATMKGIMTGNPRGTLSDEDNAVLTAGTVPFEQNAKAQKLAAYLDGKGINMIYEHVRTNTNDCSFSFHVKLNNLGDYYNIEVEHGRVEDQKEILDALMAYLGIKPRR